MASFQVRAVWDPEAQVYYSETDIPGLVVEAPSLPEFEALAHELACEVLADNLGLHGGSVEIVRDAESVAPAA